MTAVEKAQHGPWAMPDAQLVLPADAPRGRWLAERRKGIGGSDASTVVGVNRYSSRYELWLDKTGQLREIEATDRMEAGIRMEAVMRQWFTDRTGIPVRRQGLVRSRTRPWQMVSLDGLTADGGLFESKCTNWRLADEWADDQVSDHAEVQALHGLAVTGRTHAWVVALIDGWDFQIRRVERNQPLIDSISEMEERFWFDHIVAGVEPAIEAQALGVVKDRWPTVERPAVQVSPTVIRPLIAELQAAKAESKDATTRAKAAEAQIRALIGDAEQALIGDQVVATLPLIERAGYTAAPTSFRQLKIVKEK